MSIMSNLPIEAADIAAEQGWNDESLIIHLTGFIEHQDLGQALTTYFAVVAAEENASGQEDRPVNTYSERAFQLWFKAPKRKSWKFSPDVWNHLRKEPKAFENVSIHEPGKYTFMGLPFEIVRGKDIMKIIE